MRRSHVFALGCVLAFAPACVVRWDGGTNHSIQFAGEMEGRAEREIDVPLALVAGQKLAVATKHGDVVVRADASAPQSARAVLKMRARTDEEARLVLERFDVVATSTADGFELSVKGEPLVIESTFSRSELHPSVDFSISLPEGVALDARSGSGSVSASGALGATQLDSSYGAISADGVRGSLVASTKSGHVKVANIAGDVSARSSYGRVEVANVEGDSMSVTSSSGDVALENARAATHEVETKYGKVNVRNIAGKLVAKSSSGNVSGSDLEGATLSLRSNYGRVEVARAKGELEVHSSSGSVRVEASEGALKASSSYGSVEVDGVWSAVDATSSSGRVVVRAFPGSTLTHEWNVASGYGAVTLYVPSDFTCALEATTNYGGATCEFPLTIEAGTRAKDGRLVGQVGSGGALVKLHSKSGDVALKKLGD
jgi:DUF4097 and DUF4098 domain-containing protein YvlB